MRYLALSRSGIWEEIPKSLFDVRKQAVMDDGTPRYSESYAVLNDSDATVVECRLSGPRKNLGQLARLFGINTTDASFGQTYRQPEFVSVKRGKTVYLVNTQTGQKFKKCS